MTDVAKTAIASVAISRRACDAVVFDLDGVVTDTASIHAAAWKQVFDPLLGRQAPPQPPFSADDYRRHVDGRARLDGTRAFLESRGLRLPEGSPDDPPDRDTVCGIAARKNRTFLEALRQGRVRVFDDALAVIERLQATGFGVAIISASNNCAAVLEAAGIADRFDAMVDGQERQRLGLAGKPAPDVFLEAARRLGTVPARTAIVEDAIAGVAAGRAGRFGLVIGVGRAGDSAPLLAAGAAAAVSTLAAVEVVDERPGRRMAVLPSALASGAEIAARLAGRQPAVFLDYDGTLTPIVADPEAAVLSDAMRQTLARLARRCTVAVVSGRDLKRVQEFVALDGSGLYFAGSHGFDIAGPDGLRMQHPRAQGFLAALDDAEAGLGEIAGSIPGARVERKRYSVALHYRHVAPDALGDLEAALRRVLARQPALVCAGGKKVYEVQPRLHWHKGKAVIWLLQALPVAADRLVPIYLGDDLTDENAFRSLPGRGIGIVVQGGEHPTLADYALADTEEVRIFLDRLADRLSEVR